MFENILLAVDGSEPSLKAAKLAKNLAQIHQSEIRIIVTYEPMAPYLGEPYFQQAVSTRLNQSEIILTQAIQTLGDTSKELKTEVLEGPPAEAILEVAKTRDSDLIIMGTRGLGALSGILLGSQSQKVLAHANCPVLLVR